MMLMLWCSSMVVEAQIAWLLFLLFRLFIVVYSSTKRKEKKRKEKKRKEKKRQ
jgi:uncharacterized membrane protein